MTKPVNKEAFNHYISKITKAENRTDGRGNTLSSALEDINNKIDELELIGDFNEPMEMTIENTIETNNFKVGCGDNVDKSSEVMNSFSEVRVEGNSLVNHIKFLGSFAEATASSNNSFTLNMPIGTKTHYRVPLYYDYLKLGTQYTICYEYETNFDTDKNYYINMVDVYNKYIAIDCSNQRLNLSQKTGIVKKVFTTRNAIYNENGGKSLEIAIINTAPLKEDGKYLKVKNVMVLEGDHTNKPIPKYFTGLQSVGDLNEDGLYEIEVLSTGKNLINRNEWLNRGIEDDRDVIIGDGWANPNEKTGNPIILSCNFRKGVNYEFKCINKATAHFNKFKLFNSSNYTQRDIAYNTTLNQWTTTTANFTVSAEENFDSIIVDTGNATRFGYIESIQIVEKKNSNITFEPYIQDKKQILLNEPLRKVDDDIKDSIVKINGEGKIVRRCSEYTFNGTENWQLNAYQPTDDTLIRFDIPFEQLSEIGDKKLICNILNNKYIHTNLGSSSVVEECISTHSTSKSINIVIKKHRLSDNSTNGFKNWLKANPCTIIYETSTPIYEDIPENILQIWKDGHIFIDTTIPPSKVTHTVALNKPAQIASSIEELCKLRDRVSTLEGFYNAVALEQARDLSLVNTDIQMDYEDILE